MSGESYMRCKSSQASDMAAWILWHHNPASHVSYRTRDVVLELSATFEARESILSECRFDFLHALDNCSQQDVPTLLASLYCVAYAKRLLAPAELIEAIQITLRNNFKTDLDLLTLRGFITHMCNMRFFQMTEKGLDFAHPAMSKFLENLRIPGLPRGHGMFTRICFAQLRQCGLQTILQPWFNFQNFLQAYPEPSLKGYVRQFWDFHYRHVEKEADALDFAYELARMISEALADGYSEEITILIRKQIVDAGYGICDIYDFPILSTILENMGADIAYGKQRYLQPLPMHRWHKLERCSELCMSRVSEGKFSTDDSVYFREPNDLCSTLNELSTLNLNTSRRSEVCDCEQNQYVPNRDDFTCDKSSCTSEIARESLDAANPDQGSKHTGFTKLENIDPYEYTRMHNTSDDEDWEHLNDDDLAGMG